MLQAQEALLLVAPSGEDAEPRQFGTADDVELDVTTADDGRIESGANPVGGTAFSFPEFVEEGDYPRAVLTATTGQSDALSPGDESFAWGGVFLLDETSTGRAEDDGNNLVQRGLFSEPTLYKAEIDDLRPGCTVRGSEGMVSVRTPESVTPGEWYAMYCQKEGTALRVRAWPLQDEDGLAFSATEFGNMGTVRMDPTIPVSIGGKVSQVGLLVESDTDQLNGRIAEAFFLLGTVS